MNLNPPRRAARGATNTLIGVGVLVAISPLLQHAYGWWSQRQLMAQWAATSRPAKPAHKPRSKPKPSAKASKLSTASAVTMDAQSARRREVAPLPPTRLSIPDMGVDAIVVQGLDAQALARGPGHDPNSALPGGSGNCVLAAHRNVYGSWFYNLDHLWAGSLVELISDGQSYKYSVVNVRTVSEADTSVLRSVPGAPPSVTLITCTLPHSPFRLVATAYLQQE